MLEPIPDDREELSVKNFLLFKEVNIPLGNITAIIGPQASGKSIIAKLVFFGRQYLSRFLMATTSDNFSLKKFKKRQISEFNNIFDNLIGYPGEFEIKYSFSRFYVRIVRGKSSSRIEVCHANCLDKLSDKVIESYQNFIKPFDDSQSHRFLDFRFKKDEGEFFSTVPDTIFVPASRSFYSTISDELFTFVASEERVDPLTAQFGSFYEFARRRFFKDLRDRKISSTSDSQNAMRPVLMGDYIRVGSRECIQTEWGGRVHLSSSSSGQQEVLPLFLSLLEYPSRSKKAQQLIIEEPETHLFPSAQKYVLDFMVKTARDNLCDMLFTTHSPYVIACLNNHIAKSKGKDGCHPVFRSYLTDRGTAVDITDEDGFIDANFLDSVSQTIAEEFLREIE